jgi:hypothetical protein
MKVSVNINQHIGAESFPSFPASRRFIRTKRCVATKVARSRRSAATMFVHVRRNRYTFSHSYVTISRRLSLFIQILKPKRV